MRNSYSLFRKKDNENQHYLSPNDKRVSGSLDICRKSISIQDKNNILKNRINSFKLNNLVVYKKLNLRYNEPKFKKKKRFVANKLFPFKYYFCAIFVKNIDISKHRFCMSRKFIKVYSFLSQLFDISSYCVLQREFNTVKTALFDEQNIKLIEKTSKINVNSQSFMRDMNDCIGKQTFHILGNNNIKRKNAEAQKIYFGKK